MKAELFVVHRTTPYRRAGGSSPCASAPDPGERAPDPELEVAMAPAMACEANSIGAREFPDLEFEPLKLQLQGRTNNSITNHSIDQSINENNGKLIC